MSHIQIIETSSFEGSLKDKITDNAPTWNVLDANSVARGSILHLSGLLVASVAGNLGSCVVAKHRSKMKKGFFIL